MSTTMMAAYTIAAENVLVFEAQITRALSVIVPVGDHVHLAVNGPAKAATPEGGSEVGGGQVNGQAGHESGEAEVDEEEDDLDLENSGVEDGQAQVRQELEEVAEALAEILRGELKDLRWPGDI
jgi:hypothetical protein